MAAFKFKDSPKKLVWHSFVSHEAAREAMPKQGINLLSALAVSNFSAITAGDDDRCSLG